MREPRPYQHAALAITQAVGSPASIVVHTIFFILCFATVLFRVVEFNSMLLVLTTLVSLEAIYLAIFIQMTINYTTESIQEVGADIGEIQEDVEEIQEDIDEVQKDVDEIQGDVDELQEDVEEISEDESVGGSQAQEQALIAIRTDIQKLLIDIEKMQRAQMPIAPTTIMSTKPASTKKSKQSKPKKK